MAKSSRLKDEEELDSVVELRIAPGTISRLAVRLGSRLIILSVDQIDWLASEGNYVRLHVGERSYTMRGTLVSLLKKLPRPKFTRCHRSAVVNVDQISEIVGGYGDYHLVLVGGAEVPVGDHFIDDVKEALGIAVG